MSQKKERGFLDLIDHIFAQIINVKQDHICHWKTHDEMLHFFTYQQYQIRLYLVKEIKSMTLAIPSERVLGTKGK